MVVIVVICCCCVGVDHGELLEVISEDYVAGCTWDCCCCLGCVIVVSVVVVLCDVLVMRMAL